MESLERKGLIEARERGRTGRRPERTVYALTPTGRSALRDWLSELIATPTRQFAIEAEYRSTLRAAETRFVRTLLAEFGDRLPPPPQV